MTQSQIKKFKQAQEDEDQQLAIFYMKKQYKKKPSDSLLKEIRRMEAQVRGDPDPYPEGAAGGVAGPSSVPTPGPETRSKRQISAAARAPGKVAGPVGPGMLDRGGEVMLIQGMLEKGGEVMLVNRKRKSRRRNVIDSDECTGG